MGVLAAARPRLHRGPTPRASCPAARPQFSFGGAAAAAPGGGGVARRQLYQKTLTQLRALMIARMAKPEEVGGAGGRACWWCATRGGKRAFTRHVHPLPRRAILPR